MVGSYKTTIALAAAGLVSVIACAEPGDSDVGPADDRGDLFNDKQHVFLPFPAGLEVVVSQGLHGEFSHDNIEDLFAVDFEVPEGTPVAAARDGVVISVKDSSETGCGDPSCADMANWIVIDHQDGTFSNYLHLQAHSARVSLGDTVCAGRVIASSGNTGFSTGPHLHFDVENPYQESLPTLFAELDEGIPNLVTGVPYPGAVVTSRNEEFVCSVDPEPWTCRPDLFVHRGIRLDEPPPCSAVPTNQSIPISGRTLGPAKQVAVATRIEEGLWDVECVPVDESGRFFAEASWDWPGEPTWGYLMVTMVTDSRQCEKFHGPRAVLVWLQPPAGESSE